MVWPWQAKVAQPPLMMSKRRLPLNSLFRVLCGLALLLKTDGPRNSQEPATLALSRQNRATRVFLFLLS
jgi:hypothetical protein